MVTANLCTPKYALVMAYHREIVTEHQDYRLEKAGSVFALVGALGYPLLKGDGHFQFTDPKLA